MSQADVKAMTILAVSTGAIITICEEGIAGVAAPTVEYLKTRSSELMLDWPETGNATKNTRKCMVHCKNLAAELDRASERFSACVLGMLSQDLLVELRDKINNPVKLGILDELLESVNTAVDLYDPKEINDEARSMAEHLSGLVITEIEGR